MRMVYFLDLIIQNFNELIYIIAFRNNIFLFLVIKEINLKKI